MVDKNEKANRIKEYIFNIGLRYELLKRKREHDFLEGTLKETDYELLQLFGIYDNFCPHLKQYCLTPIEIKFLKKYALVGEKDILWQSFTDNRLIKRK